MARPGNIIPEWLQKHQSDGELVRAAFFGLAEAYRQDGLPYEAEQVLRQAYLRHPQDEAILGRLFALALQEKRFAEAWVWLEQLTQQDGKSKRQDVGSAQEVRNLGE